MLRGVAMLAPADAEALLRRHGLHVTAQRLAVLRAIFARPHSTAEQLHVVVRAGIGAMSRQAVYDTLATLTAKGLLRRIQPTRSAARYETRVGDDHHHLICRTCGRVVDVDGAVGDTRCLTAVDDAGYAIDETQVVFWGSCDECLQLPGVSPGDRSRGGREPSPAEASSGTKTRSGTKTESSATRGVHRGV